MANANEDYRNDPVLRAGVVRLIDKRQREAAEVIEHLDAMTKVVDNWHRCPVAHDDALIAATLHGYRQRVQRMAVHLITAAGNGTYVGNVAAFLSEHEARRMHAYPENQPKEPSHEQPS